MSRRNGFTLVEVIVVAVIVGFLLWILVPALSNARRGSRRAVCVANLKAIGRAAQNYASRHDGEWMTPAFGSKDSQTTSVTYTNGETGLVGFERTRASTRAEDQGSQGTTKMSVTRALWMLVRTSEVAPASFVCPGSRDRKDSAGDYQLYYDFESPRNVSYGYQVPFGPPHTRARKGMDNRKVVLADKGPFALDSGPVKWTVPDGSRGHFGSDGDLTLEQPPELWRAFNSPNHGGEGQNCLYADGHAIFRQTPTAGIDHDNIYTLLGNGWDFSGFNRIHGLTPHEVSPNPFPGQDALGRGRHSSTDSLVYP